MADIPINPVTRRVEFTGNTGTGPFAFTFNVLAQADIAAYKNNTLLALTSDYPVSLNSNGPGSITLVAALIASDELVIIGDLPLSRTTDFVTAGDLLASSLNQQFDSNVVMSQQLDERFDRTIRSQPGDINKNLYLPLVSSRASQLLSFDSSGNITTTSLANVPDIGTVNLSVSGVASFADGSASAPSITNIGDTNTGMYFGAADQINFSIGGSEVISVASTGTTISGLSISSGDILLTDNSATALEIKEGSNNYLTFITTNGSEKLSFGSTANPTFEVNGSFRQPLIAATTSFFSQTYSGATLSATNGAVNIESYSASKAGIVLNGSGDQITFTSPTLGFVGLVQVVGAITTDTSLNIASSTTVDGILDEDDMTSNSETKLATQQSIKAYVDAQVGTVDTLAEILANGNTTGGTDIVVSVDDVISLDNGTNALPSLTTTGDLNTGLYFPAADEVGITTGGTQRVKVDSTGIDVTGTVTADGLTVAKGSVGQVASFSGDDVSGARALQVIASTTTNTGDTHSINAQSSTGIVKLSTNNNTQRLAVFPSGDISFYEDTGTTAKFFWDASEESLGIGTSSPTSALDVRGESVFGSGTDGVKLTYSAGNSTGIIDTGFTSTGLEFRTGNSFAAKIDSSGNVGIGTSVALTGPSAATALRIGNQINIYEYDDGSNPVQMNIDQNIDANENYITTDHAARYQMRDGVHKWFTVGSGTAGAATNIGTGEAMRIDSSGNLLINRTSKISDEKLSVKGEIRAGYTASDNQVYLGVDSANAYLGTNASGFGLKFEAGGSERMRIDSSGHAIIPAGVTLGTAAGVYAAANTLDDYEVGEFQMTASGVSGGAFGSGKYLKVGSLVHFQWYSGAMNVTGSGNAILTGLPFTTTGVSGMYASFSSGHNTYSGTTTTGYLQLNGNIAYFIPANSTTIAPYIAGSSQYVMIAGTYYTDA